MNFGWVIPNVLAGCRGPLLAEELEYLKDKGVKAIIRMERRTISGEGAGLVDLAEFVPDFQPPTSAQMDRIIEFIDGQTQQGSPVAVSCRAGVGRTGTVLACYLIHRGSTAEEALQKVRQLRPGSVESPFQQGVCLSVRGAEQAVPGLKEVRTCPWRSC